MVSLLTKLKSLRKLIFHQNFERYSKMAALLPPEKVKGMKVLEKEKFDQIIRVPALLLIQINMHDAVRVLKQYLLKQDNFKPIQVIDSENQTFREIIGPELLKTASNEYKLAHLNPNLIGKWSDFTDDDIMALEKIGIEEKCFTYNNVTFTYENWKCDEILKAILPSEGNYIAGYSIIGHIIHVNLREHHLEYKNIIGRVLLDKIKNCTTVVNKTNQIDNTYRNFSMEVLCGESNFITRAKENKCVFEFDFSKVYWNPRLSTEHERITDMLNPDDVLFDVFAGVGPFAIPASKKKCTVFANDLNPESYKWLDHNAKLNKIKRDNFQIYNKDGREFITEIIGDYLRSKNELNSNKIHITMNLPAMAVEFLDAFNLIDRSVIDACNVPIIVHVYIFVIGEQADKTAELMVNQNIGYDVKNHIIEVVDVRNVAPNKEMMRVTFSLNKNTSDIQLSKTNKRRKTSVDVKEPEIKQSKSCS